MSASSPSPLLPPCLVIPNPQLSPTRGTPISPSSSPMSVTVCCIVGSFTRHSLLSLYSDAVYRTLLHILYQIFFFFLTFSLVFRCCSGGFFYIGIIYHLCFWMSPKCLVFVLWTLRFPAKRGQREERQGSFCVVKKIVLICLNIIISRHLNMRGVIILCCFLKYHFICWCCDCHSCWCWACFCSWGSRGRLYRVRLWALSGSVRVLQRLDIQKTQKSKGITCKIADISSKTSQVWRRTNPLLHPLLPYLSAVTLPPSFPTSASEWTTRYGHDPSS